MIDDRNLHLFIDEELFVFDQTRVEQAKKESYELVILTDQLTPEESDNLNKILAPLQLDPDKYVIKNDSIENIHFKKLAAFGRKESLGQIIGNLPEPNSVADQGDFSVFYTYPMKELISFSPDQKRAFWNPFKTWING